MTTIRELSRKYKLLQRRISKLAEDEGEWKTINGRHVLVGKGESMASVLERVRNSKKRPGVPIGTAEQEKADERISRELDKMRRDGLASPRTKAHIEKIKREAKVGRSIKFISHFGGEDTGTITQIGKRTLEVSQDRSGNIVKQRITFDRAMKIWGKEQKV